jgi:hypothetical protein
VNYAQAAKNALVAQVGGGSSPAPAVTTKKQGGATATPDSNPSVSNPSVSPDVASPTDASVSVNVAAPPAATAGPLNVPTTLQTVTHTTTKHRHGPAVPQNPQNKGVVSE